MFTENIKKENIIVPKNNTFYAQNTKYSDFDGGEQITAYGELLV